MDDPSNAPSNHARVRVHPGLLFMGLLGAAGLLHYLIPSPLPMGPLEPQALRLMGMAFLEGFGLGVWSFFCLKRAGTNFDPLQPTTALVVRGPYRFTRNPLYLAQLLVMLGFAALTRSWWFLGAVPVLAVCLHSLAILPEERYLAGLFGDDYVAYCERVRRWV